MNEERRNRILKAMASLLELDHPHLVASVYAYIDVLALQDEEVNFTFVYDNGEGRNIVVGHNGDGIYYRLEDLHNQHIIASGEIRG